MRDLSDIRQVLKMENPDRIWPGNESRPWGQQITLLELSRVGVVGERAGAVEHRCDGSVPLSGQGDECYRLG